MLQQKNGEEKEIERDRTRELEVCGVWRKTVSAETVQANRPVGGVVLMTYPDILREPHVSQEQLQEATHALRGKNYSNTRFLKKHLSISGVRAGAVFRRLGWEAYSRTTSSRTYRRVETK